MKLELKCPTCGEYKYLIIESGIGDNAKDRVLVCKNKNCIDFDSYFNLDYFVSEYLNTSVIVQEGFTGEVEFENDNGNFKEIYENGFIKASFQLIDSEWKQVYPEN